MHVLCIHVCIMYTIKIINYIRIDLSKKNRKMTISLYKISTQYQIIQQLEDTSPFKIVSIIQILKSSILIVYMVKCHQTVVV